MQQQSGGDVSGDELLALGMLGLGIAHDLDNVLIGISECIEGARAPSSPPDHVRRCLAEASAAAGRGRALTRELFEIRRRTKTDDACHLDEVIRRHEPMLRRMLAPGVELVMVLDGGDVQVAMAPGRVERILSNLCRNAVQAMRGGGHLLVATRTFEGESGSPRSKSRPAPSRRVQLTVEDTGTGMDEMTRSRALEPFFTTRADAGGTGLGLPTVACIARLAGGSVSIESTLGRGTSVRLDLPVHDAR